jgi:hypothetical protein
MTPGMMTAGMMTAGMSKTMPRRTSAAAWSVIYR